MVALWPTHLLERRKGGGGGGGGGGRGGGSGGSSASGGKSGSTSSGGSSRSTGASESSRGSSVAINSPSGSTATVRSYGVGSRTVTTIPAGVPFAGRSIGGGTRDNIFGTRRYGSGYPGIIVVGVSHRGFPFGFWPIAFGTAIGVRESDDFRSDEYGEPNNSSRPGGPLFDAAFQPPDGTNVYRVLSDNTTVHELVASITTNCSLSTASISAVPFNSSDDSQPKPEQVIQYYRASSVALTLDGYNNSAVFSSDTNATDTPLPSNLNSTFLSCINQTIGAAAPLYDATVPGAQVSGFLGLALVTLHVLRWYLF